MRFIVLILFSCFLLFAYHPVFAQDQPLEETIAVAPENDVDLEGNRNFHSTLKGKFIEGDWRWMTPILLCFIFGLAVIIQRIIILNLKAVNSRKLLRDLESHLSIGDIDNAEAVILKTRGPLASIFEQGLRRTGEGIDIVEKSIISHGSLQMSLLERGLIWVSLFIALAPMLGFLGTVVGMVVAFDDIEAAGDISPTLVAGGIKIALITTVAGLIVAIILQVFYNYLLSKIDRIVHDMEEASIAFVDMLLRYNISKRL
ncbi:MAG: MotA/TolQ/ExbB proton channel family protein [Bacteroidota bacterium]|nr:MotA/TolQ/ExbB proton channel family protein [Bacteroidota bacterium]